MTEQNAPGLALSFGVRIDNIDVIDCSQFGLAERPLHGEVALERELRGFGIHRLAVMELDVRPQSDGDDLAVG